MDFLERDLKTNPSGLALALSTLCFESFRRDSRVLRERLAARQLADGSWRGQPHLTALAVLALRTEGGENVFKV